ncbi:hypothetical protein EMPS_04494 [Entomortierella parvispora]|uniref:Uncharacterized protein n=1 Tax=Entomortierella parvispora TaxID=205924 RepID=A0A9P3H9C8_9FUNG|nr:hypothetical protein EMPS_04494 [Entomortierella parvispora]
MESSGEAFDSLCRSVFLSNNNNEDLPSDEETALSLLSQARVYELPSTFVPPVGAPAVGKDRRCYRIHLDSLQDRPLVQRAVHGILVKGISPGALWELPFDRNLTGYSTQSRSEVVEAPLQTNVVLDMEGLESSTEHAAATTDASDDHSQQQHQKVSGETIMLLIPTPEWLRLTGRIRYWRAESHRIKSAEREAKLDSWLEERWKGNPLSSSVLSSPPMSSGSLLASEIPPKSLPSSPVSSASSSPASSPRSSTVPQGGLAPLSLTRPSLYKQPFQEQQLESLVDFMVRYGDEPSAASLLKGLLDLCRRQVTETTVYAWTIDRANLTEQKPEVSEAFLNLMARLGFEYVNSVEEQQAHLLQLQQLQQREQEQEPSSNGLLSSPSPSSTSAVPLPPLQTSTSFLSVASDATAVDPTKALTSSEGNSSHLSKRSTEIKWTLGSKVDDRRLEYWIHNVQQPTLPVLQMDGGSILPLNFAAAGTSSHSEGDLTLPTISSPKKKSASSLDSEEPSLSQHKTQPQSDKKPNPIPVQVRKRFLQDKHTIPAGSIQALTQFNGTTVVVRDRAFVALTSAYRLSGAEQGSGGMFVDKVKNDVKYLARWASTCGGRLDWIWTWLFSSFQRSRRSGSSDGQDAHRRPRLNDENV